MQTIGAILRRMAAADSAGLPASISFVRPAGPVPAGAVADLAGGLWPAYLVRGADVAVMPRRARALLLDGAARPVADLAEVSA